MAKKSSGLSARGVQAQKSANTIRGDKKDHRKIDFSELPELSSHQLSQMRPLGRPLLGCAPRKMIAVRVDPEVLQRLKQEAKSKGKGYQTLINEILKEYIEGKKAA